MFEHRFLLPIQWAKTYTKSAKNDRTTFIDSEQVFVSCDQKSLFVIL